MGGMQKHSHLLADHVAALGVRVVLYHCVETSELPTEAEVLSGFSEGARQNITVRTFQYTDEGRLPGHYLRAQRRLSDAYFKQMQLETFVPDFIYTKGFVGQTILERRSELPFDCKIGVKFHGMNMFQVQPNLKGELVKYMLRPAARSIMRQADVVFSYGGKITKIISDELKDGSKIIEFPSGISQGWIAPVAHIRPASKKYRFLFVGRFDRLKGLPELYKAISMLAMEKDWQIEIVGPIPEEHRLNHSRVEYIGEIRDEQALRKVYDRNDILLCPSISEGMPNVIMEAMARGLAIIATDVGATRILVNPENGWLLEAPKPKLIWKAIEASMEVGPEAINEMKKVSISRMRNSFTWEAVANRFHSWLAEYCT